MHLNCSVGEDSWESLGLQGDQTVHPKGDQSWVFIGRNDAKAETPAFWPPHVKSWLIGKDSDAGRDWGQEEKGTTEDEMAGWHHRLNGHEFESTLGVGNGQGSLVCCSPWGDKESDMTEWMNWWRVSWWCWCLFFVKLADIFGMWDCLWCCHSAERCKQSSAVFLLVNGIISSTKPFFMVYPSPGFMCARLSGMSRHISKAELV